MLLLAFAKKWEIISGGRSKKENITLLRGQVYFTFYKLYEHFAIYSLQS